MRGGRGGAAIGFVLTLVALTACSSVGSAVHTDHASGTQPVATGLATPAPPTTVEPTTAVPASAVPASAVPASAVPASAVPTSIDGTPGSRSAVAPRTSAPRSTPPAGPDVVGRLPVKEPTADARQVVTVVAASRSSTTATVQRWNRVAGGWARQGAAIPANLGSDGLSAHASEAKSATPIGSFTLTHAFGAESDPGTRLPYAWTTPDDWWISEPGPLYNTRQRCSSGCDFTRGDPNEHLFYETPDYDYAVVIDYNTRNAPGGVQPGRGSAFFLHVSVGRATAGCVSVPATQLLRIMHWLKPDRNPRILIGVG